MGEIRTKDVRLKSSSTSERRASITAHIYVFMQTAADWMMNRSQDAAALFPLNCRLTSVSCREALMMIGNSTPSGLPARLACLLCDDDR